MRSLLVSGMVMRDEVSAKEAFLGSVTTQTVVRMCANAAIDNYIKAAKPEGAEDSGRPVVIHSSQWEKETGRGGTRKGNHARARAKMPAAESIPAPEQE
jgi:hypothetical protein